MELLLCFYEYKRKNWNVIPNITPKNGIIFLNLRHKGIF